MSRIGKSPIALPSGVEVEISKGNLVTVKGPKGTLKQQVDMDISVAVADGIINVSRPTDQKRHRALHGLYRALIANMVKGVTEGFSKDLEINGVGYRVALAGNALKMHLGYSHEVVYALPAGVTATVNQNSITVSGINKQQVGQVAAEIRSLKKPEPYKGKGIKYSDERIVRKSGKSGKDK